MFGKGKKSGSASSRTPQHQAGAGTGPHNASSGQRLQLPTIAGRDTLASLPGQPERPQGGDTGRAHRPTIHPESRFHPNDPTGPGHRQPSRPLPRGPALIDSPPGRSRPQQPASSPAPASRHSPAPAQQGPAQQSPSSSERQRRSAAPSPPHRLPMFGQPGRLVDIPHGNSTGGKPKEPATGGNPKWPRYCS